MTIRGPIFPVTPIVVSDFTSVNQGSASFTQEGDGAHLHDPTTDNSINYRIWKKTYTAPKAVKVLILPKLLRINFQGCGIGFFDNSDQARVLYVDASTSNEVAVLRLDSPTSQNGGESLLGNPSAWRGGYIWLGIEDDNTNQIFSYSSDGKHFQKIFSISRTNFLTPTGFGVFVNSRSSQPCGMTVLSWEESTTLTYT